MLLTLMWACAVEEALYTGDNLTADIEGYEDWAQPVGWAGAVPSCNQPHAPYVEIWFNKIASEAMGAGSSPLPEGSAIVHQAFEEDQTTKTVMSAMRKVNGFAPETGDWFWGQFDADGTELSGGDLPGCTECHVAGEDFVHFLGATPVDDPADCP